MLKSKTKLSLFTNRWVFLYDPGVTIKKKNLLELTGVQKGDCIQDKCFKNQ